MMDMFTLLGCVRSCICCPWSLCGALLLSGLALAALVGCSLQVVRWLGMEMMSVHVA